jgi:DNA-binding response OmpR family regulator
MSHKRSSRGERHNNHQELSTILVAESDRATANLIRTALESVGEQVVLAMNWSETISHYRKQPVDVAVIDFTLMEKQNRTNICIFQQRMTPIILTALARQTERLLRTSLLYDVDDYITRPFSIDNLLMRIQRVRQRNGGSHSAARRRAIVGDLQLDHVERQVTIEGRQVNLTPTEYRLLKMLMQSPDKAVHKAELVEAIWKNRFYNDENVLRVTMRRLRSKIELDPSRPAYLVTVYGKGYKLVHRDHSEGQYK